MKEDAVAKSIGDLKKLKLNGPEKAVIDSLIQDLERDDEKAPGENDKKRERHLAILGFSLIEGRLEKTITPESIRSHAARLWKDAEKLQDEMLEAYERGFRQGGVELARLNAIERSGYLVQGKDMKERTRASNGLLEVFFGFDVQKNLRAIPEYSDARVIGGEDLSEGSGVWRIHLKISGNEKTVILKKIDPRVEMFGARLATAAGILSPKVQQIGPGYALIEDITVYEGKTVPVTAFGQKIKFRVSSAGLFHEQLFAPKIFENSCKAATMFWTLVGSNEGRERLFRAWIEFQDLSRICLLGDRQHRNAAVAFGENGQGINIMALDMESIAPSLVSEADDAGSFSGVYRNLAVDTFVLASEIARASRFAKKTGLVGTELERDSMLDEIVVALRGMVSVNHTSAGKMIIAVIEDPANAGIPFGLVDKKDGANELGQDRIANASLSPKTARLLAAMVRKACTSEEREAFLQIQIKEIGVLRKSIPP